MFDSLAVNMLVGLGGDMWRSGYDSQMSQNSNCVHWSVFFFFTKRENEFAYKGGWEVVSCKGEMC